jgi:hypothetical protein
MGRPQSFWMSAPCSTSFTLWGGGWAGLGGGNGGGGVDGLGPASLSVSLSPTLLLAAPSAVPLPTPESKIAELTRETRRAGLVLLQTLAIISDGQPSGQHFATLAAKVTAVTSNSDTETATGEAHRLALALRLVLDAAT